MQQQVRHPTQQSGLVGLGFTLTRRQKSSILIQMRFPPLALKGCVSRSL